ncbi:nucleoside hydrolase [Falsirhodobacter algicola]|uniref:Inosine/uridine-preferring nucleoside hydrolase domain-containing protein n=1 Tax=Falsirhodobacter algicola TaxID=2692330 RepID=A0A8J8MRK8_9RHOB|nr:nucleoside hydrolase [Falsirhodobacter algicola]QUS35229.1 hypothetical protein GR316_02425 [Falsirhodobacter algicola]
MMRQMVILDTDCSQDAAIAALFLLLAPGRMDVAGITVADGPSTDAWQRAHALRDVSRRNDVPILPGGPGDATEAAAFIIRTVRANPPDSVTICCCGPLTNIAAALRQAPDIGRRLQSIVLATGRDDAGKDLAYLRADPEAARTVLESEASLVVVPDDLGLPLTHGDLTCLGAAGDAGRLAAEMLGTAVQILDAGAVAYLLQPHLFLGRPLRLEVTEDDIIVDRNPPCRSHTDLIYMIAVDQDALRTMVSRALCS